MPELRPPKWYTTNEIYEWLKRKAPVRISNKLSKRDAEWLAGEFQKAFEKGWEKALRTEGKEAKIRTETVSQPKIDFCTCGTPLGVPDAEEKDE